MARRLVIVCTARAVNPISNQPRGRPCSAVFESAKPYTSRANWIERARAAGWRVSPLAKDGTVNAACPDCTNGTRPKKTTQKGATPPMSTDTDAGAVTRAALLGQITATDQSLTFERNARAAVIRQRTEAATRGPWTMLDRRGDRANAQIEVHLPRAGSYTHIANVMRRGPNPAADATFITAAPVDMLWLLDEVDRLRAERDLLLAAASHDARLDYYSHRAEARLLEVHQARRALDTPRRPR